MSSLGLQKLVSLSPVYHMAQLAALQCHLFETRGRYFNIRSRWRNAVDKKDKMFSSTRALIRIEWRKLCL